MRVAGMIAISVAVAVGPGPLPPYSAVAPASAEGPDPGVPAAVRGWRSEELVAGLTLYRGALGDPARPGRWTVTVLVPGSPPADLGRREATSALAARLTAAGFTPRMEPIHWSRYEGGSADPLGWRVRIGAFTTREQADAQVRRLKRAGFFAAAEWTREDPAEVDPRSEPSAQVRVVILDPRRYRGEITASYGTGVAGRETTTSMARAAGAVLAVNAGFFILHDRDGIEGVPAGIGIYDGKLESLAANGRAALLLGGPRIARLSTSMSVDAAGRQREIDGVNRAPGLIRNCGGVGGDEPTERPRHDTTCTDPAEIVLYTSELGGDTPSGGGVEAVLDGTGRVVAHRRRGGPVPAGGSVLAGIGDAATWLSAHAPPGTRLDIRQRIWDGDGRPVAPGDGDVVNGGPWLIRNGEILLDVVSDGVLYPENPAFLYNWGIKRNPRVMLGIDRWRRLILVTADGRQPGYSDGLSLVEGARFLRELGAEEAINLDGGGSVSLAVRGRLDNRPSNKDGERAIGDALLFLPRSGANGG